MLKTFTDLKDIKKLTKEAKVSIKDGDTTVVVNKELSQTIIADKNFQEIQQYMMESCPRMKALVASNDMLSDKSLSKNAEALKLYYEGEQLGKKDKYEKAIACYKKAVALDPEFAFAWDNMGMAYRKMMNLDEALKCYKKSLEIDPYGTMPLQNSAIVYELKKDYKNAGDTYLKLIEMEPDNAEGYYGAGRAFYFNEEYDKGCDYMFKAYVIYSETRSPYLKDAENVLNAFYADLKEKGKLDIIKAAAKKNNINMD